MRKVPKAEIAEALRKSKELERRQPLPKKEVIGFFKEGIQRLDGLKDLLRGSWFIRDRDAPARKSRVRRAKPKGHSVKGASSSRKKRRGKRSSRRKSRFSSKNL